MCILTEKPSGAGIIVPCSQIDTACLGVIVLPAVAEGVIIRRGGFLFYGQLIAKAIILVVPGDFSACIHQLRDVSMDIGQVVLHIFSVYCAEQKLRSPEEVLGLAAGLVHDDILPVVDMAGGDAIYRLALAQAISVVGTISTLHIFLFDSIDANSFFFPFIFLKKCKSAFDCSKAPLLCIIYNLGITT